ncbi:MAG: KUP/HAK/KT family potassium transporter [Candidatus Eremiobacteraeota bacterium]|nr:KUP/HAK/KT family potassium transporter [Candidatus Eremiobacteraeota bacterium]
MSDVAVKAQPKAPPESEPEAHRVALPALALAALGVVFGDIGTSPLYAFRQCFIVGRGFAPTHEHVLGILSLIFWALTGVVCINYTSIILRANYEGEGGILALLALLKPTTRAGNPGRLPAIALLVLLGAGMLYGDGIITPAISVLSAVEGLGVATKAAQPFIVPLTVAILAALFYVQRYGTGRIGNVFGPVMVLWFVAIGLAGALAIIRHPLVLEALDPRHAFAFLIANRWAGILVLGAVVLCVSGVEALYADLGHFGLKPIQASWFSLVYPALLLNYFGQGALVLQRPAAIEAPFYSLVANWALYPMVFLATLATVIASQALISGVYSLTQQAVQLGYSPRVNVIYTSRRHAGRIYMPAITAFLAILCILIVVTFRSSDRLGAAYGLAVTVTMLCTSLTYGTVARKKWRWPWWRLAPLLAFFLMFDLSFLTGNLPKLVAGGWIPALIALVIFTLFTTWVDGRRRFAAALDALSTSMDEFCREVGNRQPDRAAGTAIVLTPSREGVPFALRHEWLRHEILHEQIVLLTIVQERRPFVPPSERVRLENLTDNLVRVTAHYGFTQQPDVNEIFAVAKNVAPGVFGEPIYFFLARPRLVIDRSPEAMRGWRRTLYTIMLRNATPLTDSLGIPPTRIIEFGVAIPV